jgi:surface polysaccharide O-acyltransferase-like enzyme
VFVKYNTAKIAARINRTIRSALPMFFFITNFLLVNNLNKNNKNGNDEYTRKADSNKFVNWLPFFHLHIKIR